MTKEISSHFQEEIRIRKQIIEEERKIENLNIEFKEKEYELYKLLNQNVNNKEKGSGLKQKELKQSLQKINEQIEQIRNNLNDKFAVSNELVQKREELSQAINKLIKEPLGSSLKYTFDYNVVLVENIILEHRRNINLNQLKLKEAKMNKIIEQLKVRDNVIKNAQNELAKKNLKIKMDENVKAIEDLNLEHSFTLPVVINVNQSQKIIPVKNNSNKNMPKLINRKNDLNNSGSNLNYEAYNNPNIIKKKMTFKSKTTEIINKVKRNELTDLKLNVINDYYPNSKIKFINSKSPINNINSRDVIAFDTRILAHSPDKINMSMSSHKSTTEMSNRSTSRIEREVDKKVKNILKNNIIGGRYKSSPYINK